MASVAALVVVKEAEAWLGSGAEAEAVVEIEIEIEVAEMLAEMELLSPTSHPSLNLDLCQDAYPPHTAP